MSRLSNALAPLVPLGAWVLAMAGTGRWPGGDGPHLLGTAMRLSQLLRAGEIGELWRGLGTLIGPHPPLAYLPATLVYSLVGTGWRHAHLLAGALVLYLCWDGIRRLGGGIVGALFLASTGLVWAQAEGHGPDLLAAACVIQALSWLVRSDGLRHRRPALFWGAWMGIGFLTKYTVPLFLWAPCLLAGLWTLRHGRWRQLLTALLAFLVVAAPWYLLHLRGVAGYLGASTGGQGAVFTNKAILAGPWWSLDRLSWYPAVLADALGWIGVSALLTGSLAPRRRGLPRGALSVPLLAVLGGWLLLTMQSQRQDRYLLPMVPLLAAVAGSSRIRWLLAPIGAIGAYGAASTYLLYQDVPGTRVYSHAWPGGGDWPWVHEAFRPVSLDPRPWKLDEGIALLREHQGSDAGTVAFLLDERDGGPGFGVVLSRVASMGLRWDIATLMVMEGSKPEAAVFVGPFAGEDWPSRDFRTLLAIVDPQDHRRQRWLEQSRMTLQERWALPMGREGRIYTWEGEGSVPGTPPPLPPLKSNE